MTAAWRIPAAVILIGAFVSASAAQQTIVDYCTPGPYIVFFDRGSTGIGTEAKPILQNMLDNLATCGTMVGRIEIEGFTDTSEAPRLSRARAAAVQRYFRRHRVGIALLPRGNGATPLRVRTAAGVPERQNRRVEIRFGPP